MKKYTIITTKAVSHRGISNLKKIYHHYDWQSPPPSTLEIQYGYY